MRVLVTGFGPFLDIVENPSSMLVQRLAAASPNGIILQTEVLPVSYRRAAQRVGELLVEGRFDVAFLLGVAGKSEQIRLERCARNSHGSKAKDQDGANLAKRPVIEGGPAILETPLNLKPVAAKLRKQGFPARVSLSAGGYVCNHTYYAALHAIDDAKISTKCVFIHVPPHTEAMTEAAKHSMALHQQEAAIRVVLDHLIGSI